MTLVETWWARGGRLLNCRFCSVWRDSRARDLIQVLRHRVLVAILSHRARTLPSFPSAAPHPAAQNVILSPIRQTDSTPPSWL